MFSKSERLARVLPNRPAGWFRASSEWVKKSTRRRLMRGGGERGNAAVVALCVTTLAIGVVLAVRLFTGGSSKPVTPIAATNIGAGESDADPGISPTGASAATSNGSGGSGGSAPSPASATPVPTLPGSVPTIPPDGAVPVAAALPVVAVDVTPTTVPPVILGLKTPQAASRNLFDAWKENDRARAKRFASPSAVEVIFRQPWGAEVQDDGCSETADPQAFHCAFVGDLRAWIVVVNQRTGPSGREFVPTRTIVTNTKRAIGSYALPSASDADSSVAPPAFNPSTESDIAALADPSLGPDPLAPLVDPAETPDLATSAIADPSLIDPSGAAAELAKATAEEASLPTTPGNPAASSNGSSARPASKAPKKKKSTIRRPKSAVSSSKSSASTDVAAEAPQDPVTTKKAAVADQPSPQSPSPEPAAPVASDGGGGAVKAGAPPVNVVDG
jgi:hypothetical protein